MILSAHHIRTAIDAWNAGESNSHVSFDLGLSRTSVMISDRGLILENKQVITWEIVETVKHDPNACFLLESGELKKIQSFSNEFNRMYVLFPTEKAPTFLISGVPMHRIKDTDPYRDTLAKIRAIQPISGRVLDTCTGLGYTAIEAAKSAQSVITIEIDPAVEEIARQNPWSKELFDDSRISRLIGDCAIRILDFPDGYFSLIIHDPPAFNIGGELYSAEFYRQLYRVLHRGGKLFHYIGDLKSSSGRRVAHGAIKRLNGAGFKRITKNEEAFGLVAYK